MEERPEHLSIGEVLNTLRDEFPDVTISKIRFLESQGLIDPERTPSGYRKFYDADVERLRWVLRQQKEHFLPLKVIRDRLTQHDDAQARPAKPRARGRAARSRATTTEAEMARLFDDDGPDDLAAATSGASLTRAELADAAGLDHAALADLERYGVIRPVAVAGERALFDEDGLAVALLAAGFARFGIEPRHLRMYVTSTDREATLFGQVLLPQLRQRNPESRAKAIEDLGELARLGRGMRAAFLRRAARELLGE